MIDGNVDISKFEQDVKPIDIKYYLIKYSRYWPLYVTCIFIALVSVFLFHRYSVEEYEVRGSILIKQKNTPEVRILDRSNIFSGGNNLENDILLLTSKSLAQEALNKLHFDVSYFASTNIKEIELYDKSPIKVDVDWNFPQGGSGVIHFTLVSENEFVLTNEERGFFDFLSAKASGPFDDQLLNKTYRFGEEITTEKSKFTVHKMKYMRDGEKLFFIIHHPSDVLESYQKSIAVRPINSYGTVLQVSTISRVVEKGRDYVNALMDSYLDYDLKEKNRITENTLAFLDLQMSILEDSLRVVENRMLNFKVENKLMDVSSEFGGVLGNIQRLDDLVQEIDFEL
ncbi:MAG: tyrosine protein kinase, partial [Cyclobacteriaceae bacterium]